MERSGRPRRRRFSDAHRGVKGWLNPTQLNLERYLYTLHRITGLGILVYLFLHILEVGSRAWGGEAYEATIAALRGPVYDAGLYVMVLGLLFHGLNGIRLILAELGISVGKPRRPAYPYRPESLVGPSRIILWVLMMIGGILVLGSLPEFLRLGVSR